MTRTYGVGLIGAGDYSAVYLALAPLFRNFEIRAIANRTPAKAEARAREFGVRAQSVDALLANDEIDIVLNVTPPAAHFPVNMDAISAGKHVYCEKPIVVDMEEGAALARAAAERGLTVGVAPDTFLGGPHQQARALIDAGRLGTITAGTGFFQTRGHENWHPSPDFFFQAGGGPVLDIGPYHITDLVNLLGPVRRVTAFGAKGREERVITAPGPRHGEVITVRTPTTVYGVLEFVSGTIFNLGLSWDVAGQRRINEVELHGTEATLFDTSPSEFGGELRAVGIDGQPFDLGPWEHRLSELNFTDRAGTRKANYRGIGLADMIDAIETGRQPRCSLDFGLHALDIMTGLLRSAETKETVVLTTTCERPAPLSNEQALSFFRQP
jgi:predicted dehydrogenase